MDWKILASVFISVFIAEMADKTQLVTMLFAADREVSKWTVFLGSASALVLTSAIGVIAGAMLAQVINVKMMSIVAGNRPTCTSLTEILSDVSYLKTDP